MSGFSLKFSVCHACLLLVVLVSGPGFAQTVADNREADTSSAETAVEIVALTVEGINTTSGEDSPGVVYILPWQPPTLPRRTRDGLETNASELLSPMDPAVFERHQKFQQSLNPAQDYRNTQL